MAPKRAPISLPDDFDLDDIVSVVNDIRCLRHSVGWDMTARTLCIDALLNVFDAGRNLPGRNQTQRFVEYTYETIRKYRDGIK